MGCLFIFHAIFCFSHTDFFMRARSKENIMDLRFFVFYVLHFGQIRSVQ